MKAITLNGFGGVETLVQAEVPVPAIKPNEVLVQVKAISLNPVDAKTRAGKGIAGRLKEEQTLILGWDVAGTVTVVGQEVEQFKVGDDVFGMVNFPGHGSAYAEYVAAPASQLALKPENVSFAEAATTTLAALTALQAMVHQEQIKPGQRVLIHAAAGGVGHFAVQIAKHLGTYVIGTSSTANKDFVLSLGADEHIDYKAQRFEEAVSAVDFVLDTIGGENLERSIEVLKPGGTLISIPTGVAEAVTAKAKAKQVKAFFFLVQSNGDDMKQLASLLEQGVIKPFISETYSFDQMAEAHKQQESGKTKGKLVIIL